MKASRRMCDMCVVTTDIWYHDLPVSMPIEAHQAVFATDGSP